MRRTVAVVGWMPFLLFYEEKKTEISVFSAFETTYRLLLQMPSLTFDTEIVIDRLPELVKAVFID